MTARPTSAKPTSARPTSARPTSAARPGVVAKVAVDPTKPKAVQSDWLIFLKQSGGPFPKEVKEAKIAECKEKFEKMKEENTEEYQSLKEKAAEESTRFEREFEEWNANGYYTKPDGTLSNAGIKKR